MVRSLQIWIVWAVAVKSAYLVVYIPEAQCPKPHLGPALAVVRVIDQKAGARLAGRGGERVEHRRNI